MKLFACFFFFLLNWWASLKEKVRSTCVVFFFHHIGRITHLNKPEAGLIFSIRICYSFIFMRNFSFTFFGRADIGKMYGIRQFSTFSEFPTNTGAFDPYSGIYLLTPYKNLPHSKFRTHPNTASICVLFVFFRKRSICTSALEYPHWTNTTSQTRKKSS